MNHYATNKIKFEVINKRIMKRLQKFENTSKHKSKEI